MILIKPLLTEKTTNLAQKGTYTFLVSPQANKHQIKTAIQSQFKVDVVRVNTIKQAARKVQSTRQRHYFKVRSKKKALVTLKAKQSIDLFNLKK